MGSSKCGRLGNTLIPLHSEGCLAGNSKIVPLILEPHDLNTTDATLH